MTVATVVHTTHYWCKNFVAQVHYLDQVGHSIQQEKMAAVVVAVAFVGLAVAAAAVVVVLEFEQVVIVVS